MPDRVNMNLRHWSAGEMLWLFRRSRKSTQKEFAALLGISEKRYCAAEHDRLSLGNDTLIEEFEYDKGDLCALARRRHGMSLRATAAMFDISHVELLTRERKADPRMVACWRSLDYRF